MSRWKASAIHLSISATIGLIVGALLLLVWYPPPYFHAAGADELVLLLVGVDIIVGPLLTLIVFRTGKKGLKFDLALIALFQSAALAYGVSVVLQSRPVFLVAAVDRFTLVSANELDAADLAKASKPEFRSLSWTGPRTIGAKLPESPQARSDLAFSGIGGKDIEKFPAYYVDYADVAKAFLVHAKSLDALKTRDAQTHERLATAVRRTGRNADQLAWVPIIARKASLLMLLDGKTGKPLRAVAVDPWGLESP